MGLFTSLADLYNDELALGWPSVNNGFFTTLADLYKMSLALGWPIS